jgi:Phage integrase family
VGLSRYAARAGIGFPPGQACGMHSLRGALAVAMIGSGTPIPVVSAVLGHASSDTTQAYYLPLPTSRSKNALSPGPRPRTPDPDDTARPTPSWPSSRASDYAHPDSTRTPATSAGKPGIGITRRSA